MLQYLITQISGDIDEIWKGKKLNTALTAFFDQKIRKPVTSENEIFTLLLEKSEKDKYETTYEFIMECDYDPNTLQLDFKSFTFSKELFEEIKEIAIKYEITNLINVINDESNYNLSKRNINSES